MSDDDWEKEADKVTAFAASNAFRDEDEEEEVNDDWDKPSAPAKAAPENPNKAKHVNKQKAKEDAAKAAAVKADLEAKEAEEAALTPEQRKQRDLQRDIDADLDAAADLFGLAPPPKAKAGPAAPKASTSSAAPAKAAAPAGAIDGAAPTTAADFDKLAKEIGKKVNSFANQEKLFPKFIEELVKQLCANVSSKDIDKLKVIMDGIRVDRVKKEKKEKEERDKKEAAKGGKNKFKGEIGFVGSAADFDDGRYDNGDDERFADEDDFDDEDFM